jgi:molecular chaperone GrpE
MQDELENQTMPTEPEEVAAGDLETEPEGPPDPIQLSRDVHALSEERDELRDSLLRKQAEFENFRKRIDRERGEFVKFASSELMREVLNVLDSFELALNDVSADDEKSASVRKGFELIYKQLLDSLKRFGLDMVAAQGVKFDPHVHEAVSTQPTDEAPEGTVMTELRKGYLLHGKLLRPAMVTVAAAAPTAPSEEGDS